MADDKKLPKVVRKANRVLEYAMFLLPIIAQALALLRQPPPRS